MLAEGGEAGLAASGCPSSRTPLELIFGLTAFALLYWIKHKVVPTSRRCTPSAPRRSRAACTRPRRPRPQAQAALEQYQAQLAEARAEASRIREDARAQGARSSPRCVSRPQAEAARITEAAHKQIEAERQQAVVSAARRGGHAVHRRSPAASSGESLEEEARQKGIVERFLAELESGEVRPEKVGEDA